VADPNDIAGYEQDSMNANERYQTQLATVRRSLTPGMAATTSDFVRNNPGLSPDSTAATMTMAQMRDYPGGWLL